MFRILDMVRNYTDKIPYNIIFQFYIGKIPYKTKLGFSKDKTMNKDDIIAEIKRTAEENGGSPLGVRRFLKETGVKVSDWNGKYWAKWNDAVKEAGYEPNQKQGSYTNENLFSSFLDFVLELGHMPTRAETRLKSRNVKNFPSDGAFSRIGSKKEFVGYLLSFCKTHESYSDAYEILVKEPHVKPADLSTDEHVIDNTKSGYVYLMKFGNEYKIGTSINVERRFRELKTQMPYNGEIIHTITTGDPEGIEAYWHRYFSDKRLKGEWFDLSGADVRYFKKRRLM